MATNPIGAGKAVVSAQVPKELAEEISRRAKRLHWTKSKYAGELLLRWYTEGCPPVSDDEALLLGKKAFAYPMIVDNGLAVAEEPTPVVLTKHSSPPASEARENGVIDGALTRLQRAKDKAEQRAPREHSPAASRKSSAKADGSR